MSKATNKTAANNRVLCNLEAEQAILSCIFWDEGKKEASDFIFAEIKIADLHAEAHQAIFAAMKVLYNKGVNIDIVTIVEILECNGNMARAGGIIYISQLSGTKFTSVNYRHYLNIVKNLSQLRQIKAAAKNIDTATGSGQTATEVLPEAIRQLTEIEEEYTSNDIEHISEANKAEIVRLKNAMDGVFNDFGLDINCFPTLNRALWGLHKGDMVTVAARPGVGKSAFAVNLLKHTAIDEQKKAIFFSLEMSKSQQIQRLYSLITGIDNYTIKSGKGLKEKKRELNEAAKKINESKLYIDDTSNLTVVEMLIKARRFKRKNGLDLVIIDYLQFVKPAINTGNRAAEVGQIARDIKNMARQLDVPIIALCQLSREQDTSNRLPVLRDLRESGEIENNSDLVLFLHSRSDKDEVIKKIDLIIGKFRNGAMKNIAMTYTGNLFKFEEIQADKKPHQPSGQQKISELIPIA